MEKVVDIKNYFSYGNHNDFCEKNSLQGSILLKDDMTFQGIVKKNDQIEKEQFIVGMIVEDQLICFDVYNLDGKDPLSFFAFSDGEKFSGSYVAITSQQANIDLGKCQINLSISNKKEDITKILIEKMEYFKTKMDPFSSHLYHEGLKKIDFRKKQIAHNLIYGQQAVENEYGIKIKKMNLNPSLNEITRSV